MPATEPITAADGTTEPDFTRAVDESVRVWAHPNPAELYRFLRSRNDLLRAIAAAR